MELNLNAIKGAFLEGEDEQTVLKGTDLLWYLNNLSAKDVEDLKKHQWCYSGDGDYIIKVQLKRGCTL